MKFINHKTTGILLALFIFLLIESCYDKDLVNISDTVYYSPEFSMPIGQNDFFLEDVISGLDEDLIEIPDTAGLPDSVPIFIYDGIVYENPVVLEHTSIESFDFSTISENLEHVISLMLRTNCVNEVPGELNVQIYFLDANFVPIANLCEDCFITVEAATIDEGGNLIKPGILTEHDIYFNEDEINAFAFVRHIRIDVVLNVENLIGKSVKYYPDQEFAVQLGFRVKFDIPLHEI